MAVVEWLGSALALLGLALSTIGLVGLLRRDDIFEQLHASGLITGPATMLVLLASFATGEAEIITSAVLVIVFLFVTTPLAGHAIARAAWRRGMRHDGEEPEGS
ncbi:sodium:proton antiporter [Thermoleophilia bacterium SCSIO 60948]|nr:sodium:proton antiporter [Thermoleophilia bacterium SCSIO 60948]